MLIFSTDLWSRNCEDQFGRVQSTNSFTRFKVRLDNISVKEAVKCLSKSDDIHSIVKNGIPLNSDDILKSGQILKVPSIELKKKYQHHLSISPFALGSVRSVSQKSGEVSSKTRDFAFRAGTDLELKDFKSRAFFESSQNLSRFDIDLEKKIFKNFYLGGRFIYLSSRLTGALGQSATATSGKVLAQASYSRRFQGNIALNIKAASGFSSDFMSEIFVSKDWAVSNSWTMSPALGMDYLRLKTDSSRFQIQSFLAGVSFKKNF